MGGSSKKPTNDSKATTPTPQQPMMTVQPAMPGQLDMLAQQLGAGFGQAQPDMLAYLRQFYQPMQVPDYAPQPAPPVTGGTPSPTTPPIPRSSPRGMGGNARPFQSRTRGGGG